MSRVTNVLLSVDYEDADVAETFSRWLRTEAPRRDGGAVTTGVGALLDITDGELPAARNRVWGGPKNPECCVWAGTLNHADLAAVVAQVAGCPWRTPAAVQLLLMDQEQNYFRLGMIRDGRIDQYAPPPPPGDDSAR